MSPNERKIHEAFVAGRTEIWFSELPEPHKRVAVQGPVLMVQGRRILLREGPFVKRGSQYVTPR